MALSRIGALGETRDVLRSRPWRGLTPPPPGSMIPDLA